VPVWLPIDAKLHQEDYQRLLDAQDAADPEGAAAAAKALERTFRTAARTIAELYVCPPETTDFAILFVPVEGLYAEILRRPGLVDGVQRDFRVMVAGPTTLCALLSSLQMGFRTLAIQQRSSEVWEVLGAVKTEFDRFGGLLDKAQKKIREAGNAIDDARVRTRTMGKKLRAVQELPAVDASALLGLAEALQPASAEPED
jgi:DNA recombination protein RmuC